MPETADAAEVRGALARLRRFGGVPVAFGGLLTDGGRKLRISELSGTVTPSLQGLGVATGNGLGGKAIAFSRPCAVTDYTSSRAISHEYDGPVGAEGLRSVLAVPVVVRGRVRAVLYGALRDSLPLGDRSLTAAVETARHLEQTLAVRDEARRLLAVATPTAQRAADPVAWENVRTAHRDLRTLAPRIADEELREELLALCDRLASAAVTVAPPAGAGPDRTVLAPRELDVLACVATGATNAAAGERLGLRPETVKSYLRSAMRKLGTHTRLEAVTAARRAGLLP
ncbi:response regulator [Streptomyces sp. CNQ-509]|uniref:helix-turn-helix transcriptional regulator n=1 Tax=unclassified Streptomyces TaxID=2593676 RepID=UPI00062DEC44|nr:helix-turn-helix transcriptional regulator [Streptomyces sp. CNQ-509]AKH85497.1 response regulator [Streptomyces sp. CNQ-509]